MIDVFETAYNATIFFYPTLEAYRSMYSQSLAYSKQFTARLNKFYHAQTLTTPDLTVVVSPNVDTLYSYAWLDLRAEPIVLSSPEIYNQDGVTRRYYSWQMVDLYTYNFANVGAPTIGNDAQQFLIARQEWEGCVPPGMTLLKSKTDYVFLFGRVRVYDDEDAKWVTVNIQPYFTLTGHESGEDSPTPPNIPAFPPININDLASDGKTLNIYKEPELFAFINFLLQYMGIYKGDQEKIERYSSIGIGAGISFTPILSDKTHYITISLGVHAAYKAIIRAVSASSDLVNGWQMGVIPPPFGNYTVMDGRDLDRAVSTYARLFGQNPDEAYYPFATADSNGDLLDASSEAVYIITFPANEPNINISQPGFWSVTLYGLNGFLVDNPINRYVIGDTTTDLHYDPIDGSLTLYIQYEEPRDGNQKRNWLPAPDAGFYLITRIYNPATLDPPYAPPPVIKIQ